jgi:hypothetical protein
VNLARYAQIVIGIAAGSLLLLWPLLSGRLDEPGRTAVLAGGGLAAFNALLAFCIVCWSEKRSTNVFLGAVLGGMLGRMGLMLVAVVAGVLLFGLPKLPLAISLLSYFVLFLVLELMVLHKKTTPAVSR